MTAASPTPLENCDIDELRATWPMASTATAPKSRRCHVRSGTRYAPGDCKFEPTSAWIASASNASVASQMPVVFAPPIAPIVSER